MKKPMPIGQSDFRKLRKNNLYYVDKTLFIREILETSSEVILLPRPRRFGKTLNLSMLRYFFEKNDGEGAGDFTDLFQGTAICDDELFNVHQGGYPVIYMTFKGLEERSWEWFLPRVMSLIRDEFIRHENILDAKALSEPEKNHYRSFLKNRAAPPDYVDALRYLSRWLHKVYEKRVIILLDEYDTPLHAGYTHAYYDDVVGFMRNFLWEGLKDNVHLFKGVITGILRVAKESIFSELNNPGVYTLLDEEFNTSFGFTENELKSLLDDNDLSDHYENVSSWYNGYDFGGEVIYNPWSVLSFAASKVKKFRAFWVNTGSTEIIDKLVTREGKELREELGLLLEGKSIEKPVHDSIVMKDLDKRANLVWGFLLFSGYLKFTGEAVGGNVRELTIPNNEIKSIYEDMIHRWFEEKVEPDRQKEMLMALMAGDVELFERELREVVLQVMSYHDFSGAPEKVYQALMIGMLVWCSDNYMIRSNRESGYGRYDLTLTPKDPGKQGIIMEFNRIDEKHIDEKRVEGKGDDAPEKTLDEALEQIERKRYETEMIAAGVKDILKLAIAFRGKELWVKKKIKSEQSNDEQRTIEQSNEKTKTPR